MRERQLLGALAISALVHTLLFAGAVGLPFVRFAANVPIELVEMKKHEPAPPLAPPSGAPKTAAPASPKKATPAPAIAKSPPRPTTPAAPDLRGVGPSGANLTLILRTASLRTSIHREGVDALLSLLPDYHTLLDGTTLHLFDDLSALLIATPDPRDVAATFLAARHADDPRFATILHKKLGPGDPRVFRALSPDLTVLGPPGIVSAMGDDDSPETQRWLTALGKFDAGDPKAALELTIADLGELVRFVGPVPLPRSLDLAMSADASPAVHLVCEFGSQIDARTFEAMWPGLQQRAGEVMPLFSGALDDLLATRHGQTIEIMGKLPERQVTLALTLARAFAPPPRGPDPGPADMQ